jgi:hypothetical protein
VSKDWPPTKEDLERWALTVEAITEPEHTSPELESFLRDPRLSAALELQEAVDWAYTNEAQITRYPRCVVGGPDVAYSWGIVHSGHGAGGHTLPEAVRALRKKLDAPTTTSGGEKP